MVQGLAEQPRAVMLRSGAAYPEVFVARDLAVECPVDVVVERVVHVAIGVLARQVWPRAAVPDDPLDRVDVARVTG